MEHKITAAVLYISAIFLCISCSPISRKEKSGPNSEPITTILGAFEPEVTLHEDPLTERREHQIEGISFVSGKLHGRNVVVVRTGIGKVNAAITTTLLIEHIASTKKCAELRKKLQTDAAEMEGAVVTQICYQRQIDHLIIRSISDSADEGAVPDMQMFYILAAKNSSDLVAEMISLLGLGLSTEKGNGNKKLGALKCSANISSSNAGKPPLESSL